MSIIKPLTLGRLLFPHNLIQAPLAGISCSAFRQLAHHYLAPAYACTEMISAYDLVSKKKTHPRYLHRASIESNLSYQLSGNDPQVLGQAAEKLIALGATMIDLNCGCPKPKIRQKGAGSKLLSDPEQLYRIFKHLRELTDISLSAKIRIGDHQNLAVVQALEAGGADFITVHGRRWQVDYETPCDNAQIADIVKQTTLPVIANGDIEDYASLRLMATQTGCAGFMIARATMGQPWVFQALAKADKHLAFETPSRTQKIHLFLEHLDHLMTLESETIAVRQMRRLAKFYFRPPHFNADNLADIYQAETKESLHVICLAMT